MELAPILSSCLLIIEAKAREKGIAVACDLSADLPPMLGDALRLKQILINLLGNAVKFTPAKGEIAIAARETSQGFLAISVADTGIGMSPAEVDTALRPFGQVDSGFNKRHEGTGLGLPIAHALARMHGGDLRIDSQKGRGTCVTLLIPMVRESAGETLFQ